MTLAFQRRQVPFTSASAPSEHSSLTAERLERLRSEPSGSSATATVANEQAPWQTIDAGGGHINWKPIVAVVLPAIVLAGAAFGIWSARGHTSAPRSAPLAPAAIVSPPIAETSLPQDIAAMAAASPVARGAAPAAVLKVLADAQPVPEGIAAAMAPMPDMPVAVADATAAHVAAPAAPVSGGWVKAAAPPTTVSVTAPTQTSGWAIAREPQAPSLVAAASIAYAKQSAPRPQPAQAPRSVPAPRAPQAVVGWPATGPLTSFFGPSHPLGIDIGIPLGTPLLAAAAGRVTFTGGDPCCSYGYYIDLDHGNGVMTRYGHLIQPSFLRPGQFVRVGDVIGYSGSTGNSTGPHLHFEIRLNGWPVDPLLVLP